MKYESKLLVRILLALVLVLPATFNLFYTVLAPLTFYSTYFIAKLLQYSPVILEKELLLVQGQTLKFIAACTAASAYYLLTLLILFTKDIKLKIRVYMWLLGSFLIFAMNVLRMAILIVVLVSFGVNAFNIIHMFFWKIVATIYVALVWIFLVWKFKVKSIPIYSDLKFLFSEVKKKRKSK